MEHEEALEHIADPFSTFSLELAQEICAVFHVDFPEHLIVTWKNAQEALYKYDTITANAPGKGILSLHLSCYIAHQLDIDISGNRYRNEVQEVRYNAREIAKKLALFTGQVASQ